LSICRRLSNLAMPWASTRGRRCVDISNFLSLFASTTGARRQVVFGVWALMLALHYNGQLLVMLRGWTDNLFGFNNRVHALEPKCINGFVVDHIANPDLAHTRAEQFTNAVINFHV